MQEDFVTVARPRDEVSANLIRIALEDAGIQAIVQPHHSWIWDGIFIPSEGSWGDVLVAKVDAERAQAILADVSKKEEDEGKEQTGE